MKMPQIIYLNINMEKEIKRSKKKEAKKALKRMNLDLSTLLNSSEGDFDKILSYIEGEITNMNEKDVNKLYKVYETGRNELSTDKIIDINSNKAPLCLMGEKSLDKDSDKYKKIIEKLSNISDKLEKFLNKKSTKIIIGFSVALFFGILSVLLYRQNSLSIEVVASIETIPEKINLAYDYVKTLGFVVAFIFLCIELVQKGLKGDTRAMAMIFAKYLLFAIFLLSFKAIYEAVDGFFNG